MRPGGTVGAGVVVASLLSLLGSPAATADEDPPAEDDLQHNVTYRARVDGLSRGALVTYRINDAQVNSADPTMLPGRTFEATAVLSDPEEAGMRISIQWPYSANLVCEILVDEQMVAAATQFIAPRLTPAKDDPDYGALYCGAPLTNAQGVAPSEDALTDPELLPGPPDPLGVDPAAEPVPPPATAVDPPIS